MEGDVEVRFVYIYMACYLASRGIEVELEQQNSINYSGPSFKIELLINPEHLPLLEGFQDETELDILNDRKLYCPHCGSKKYEMTTDAVKKIMNLFLIILCGGRVRTHSHGFRCLDCTRKFEG